MTKALLRQMHITLLVSTIALSSPCCRGEVADENRTVPAERSADATPADAIRDFFALQKQLAQIEKERADKSSAVGGLPAPLYDTYLPLARLKLDQAMLHLDCDEVFPVRGMREELATIARRSLKGSRASLSNARDAIQSGRQAVESMLAGKDPLKGMKGELIERAYLAGNDGSAQPYYIHVPASYNPEKRWPLFVFLHGWVPETSKIDPWLCPKEVLSLADEMGLFFLEPHGRRNTDFQFTGEIDVLDAIRQACRFYAIDEDRVYLIGASMGGAGVWHLAVHHPHEWAGVSPINGQVDWFAFWNEVFNYPRRDQLPPFQQWLMALNNPIDLVGSLTNLPVYAQFATRDHINNPAHTRRIIERLRGLKCPVEVFEDPDPWGHFIYFETPVYRRAFQTLSQYRRDASPRSVQHHTYSLRFPTAYWVTIDEFEEWGKLCEILAQAKEDTIEVTSRNAKACHLNVPAKLFPDGARVKVIWNGKEAFSGTLPVDRRLRLGPSSPPGPLRKSSDLCGPIPDAFNFRFLLVRGTTGTQDETTESRDLSDCFRREWWSYAEGLPPVKEDKEVTAEDVAANHLVLFGRPHTNALLARIADQLPVRIGRDDFQIGARRYSGNRLGLAMIYPNPLNPKKYVVVFSGYRWGERRGSNHKWDLLPDFIVFQDQFDPAVDSNRALCAGFFDTQWKITDALTWTVRAE